MTKSLLTNGGLFGGKAGRLCISTVLYAVYIQRCSIPFIPYEAGIAANKTERGTLVSTYGCTAESADHEFTLAMNDYLSNKGKQRGTGVIAYQLRQSFKPGEVTPEEANRIGYELASRLLGGDHAFLVATHTDRHHIHNHIVCAPIRDRLNPLGKRQARSSMPVVNV